MADAPRLHALWTHVEGRSVLAMPRREWDSARVSFGAPTAIDVARTPLSGVAQGAAVLAVVAQQISPSLGEISIFREDLKDPMPVNHDKYSVVLDLPSHPNFLNMVTRASTEDNDNMRQYLGENVFLVKQDRGADHWLPSLPASVSATLKST